MIRNRDALLDHGNREARATLLDVARAAVEAVHPRRTVPAAVGVDGPRLRVGDRAYDLDAVDDVSVVGAGKGAAAVAAELSAILGDRLAGGVVAAKAGDADAGVADAVAVIGAGHPIPDDRTPPRFLPLEALILRPSIVARLMQSPSASPSPTSPSTARPVASLNGSSAPRSDAPARLIDRDQSLGTAEPGFAEAVSRYLEAERRTVEQDIEVLTAYGPFRKANVEERE
jgi:hypothetical protein